MSPPEPLWTAKDVAAYARLTERHIWDLARNGQLPMTRIGRRMRFDPRTIRLHFAAKAGAR